MRVEPHLLFQGTCEEAFDLYAKVLRGEITFKMTYGNSPEEMRGPKEWHDKLMHATLKLPSGNMSGNDAPADRYQKPSGITMTIQMSDVKEAERVFAELSAGGQVQMPLAETFWAARFGMFTDRFGIPWMVNCEKAA
jgi:PhnB protein